MKRSENYFEKENARYLSKEELVKTFVPTETFRAIFDKKNHFILGSRGSGKTSVAKMVSHSYLALFSQFDSISRDIINSKEYIGVYVPMSAEWLGGINNKAWFTIDELNILFEWKLNLNICIAFVDTIESCCECYLKDISHRYIKEKMIVKRLVSLWCPQPNELDNFKQLTDVLKLIEFEKQKSIAKDRALGNKTNKLVGECFSTQLFNPLLRAIDIVDEELSFLKQPAWLLCLDEVAILSVEQQRIINSYLRSSMSNNIFIKIITTPYSNESRETNIGVPLNQGDDYENLYIDHEPTFFVFKKNKIPEPVLDLFDKRIQASGDDIPKISLNSLLGKSSLLDDHPWNFSQESQDMKLFNEFASNETKLRGKTLLSEEKKKHFSDQIARKMRGLLYLKNAVKNNNLSEVYSGIKMIVYCSDANPRKLIRLFNQLLKQYDPKKKVLTPTVQSTTLYEFSRNTLNSSRSEEEIGIKLYDFICVIGNYMKDKLHSEETIGTEQISTIDIGGCVDADLWNLIKKAVDIGLLYPIITSNSKTFNRNKMNKLSVNLPVKNGKFRLAYVLSPFFTLLPRQGSSRALSSILDKKNNENKNENLIKAFKNNADNKNLKKCIDFLEKAEQLTINSLLQEQED